MLRAWVATFINSHTSTIIPLHHRRRNWRHQFLHLCGTVVDQLCQLFFFPEKWTTLPQAKLSSLSTSWHWGVRLPQSLGLQACPGGAASQHAAPSPEPRRFDTVLKDQGCRPGACFGQSAQELRRHRPPTSAASTTKRALPPSPESSGCVVSLVRLA